MSSTGENSVKARQGQNKNSIHVVRNPAVDLFPTELLRIAGRNIQILESQMIAPGLANVHHKHMSHDAVTPDASLNSGSFEVNGQYDQHEVKTRGMREILESLYYKISLTNSNTGGNTRILPVEMWGRIEIFINGYSNLIQEIRPWDQFIQNMIGLTDEQEARIALVNNRAVASPPTFASGANIGISSTVIRYLEIPGLWQYGDWYLNWCHSITLRWRYEGASRVLVTDGTGGQVSVSALEVLMRTREISPEEQLSWTR